MRLVCASCGETLTGVTGGRPRVTCSRACAQRWGNARRRAARDQSKVIHHLQEATQHAANLRPDLALQVAQLCRRFEALKPAEVARIRHAWCGADEEKTHGDDPIDQGEVP